MLPKLAAIVAMVAGIIGILWEVRQPILSVIACCPAFAGTRVAENYRQSKVLTQLRGAKQLLFF